MLAVVGLDLYLSYNRRGWSVRRQIPGNWPHSQRLIPLRQPFSTRGGFGVLKSPRTHARKLPRLADGRWPYLLDLVGFGFNEVTYA